MPSWTRRRGRSKRGRNITADLVVQNFDSQTNALRNRIAADNCAPLLLACSNRCREIRNSGTYILNALAIEDITNTINNHSVYLPAILYTVVDGMSRYSDLTSQEVVNQLAEWAGVDSPKVEEGGILNHVPNAKEQMRRLVKLPLAKLRYLYQMFPTIFAVIGREDWVREASSSGPTAGTRKSYADLNLVCIMIRSLQETAK